MSHIPQAKTGLKPPSKIHKAVQGGASTSSPSNSTTTVVRRGSAPPTKSTATPSSSKTSPLLGKATGAGGTSGVVKRGSTSSTATGVSPRASPRNSMISSATSSQQQPKLSRENSETRLQYRRESSSSSIKSTGSESSGSVVRRRGSQSQQAATSAADLKKFFSIGDRVLVSGAKPGVIAFIGETQFAKGDWAGVILDEPTGKNNGTVAGVRYFECKPQHGVFTKLEKITKINKVTEQLHNEGPSTALEIGDRIVVSGTKIGTVRYVGTTGFAKGEWTGVELDEPLGKNDGAVAGTRYFRCQQDYGLFAPVHKVIKTGKKENTKLLTSPPQTSEAALNSLSTPAAPKTSRENSVSSPELTPLLLSSASTLGKKAEEADEQTQASPAKTPFHVSLQVVALQEALQDRERQIQTLLEERDFERNEVASATSQVSKAEEELINIRKKHEEASIESTKSIDTLKSLVELAEKEKSELSLQVEEEKRKNEDLLFKLEEEEIILGDELKTDENRIKEQQRKLHENQETISRLHNELENIKAAKSDSDKKAEDMEFQLLEFTEDSSSFQLQLEESQNRVKELESKLTSLQEQHSAQSGKASRGREEQFDKIKQLEKDLNTRNSKCKELEVALQNANIQLKRAQEDNETFKDQVEDFTSKLYSKEHEFASMSEELKLIKAATLELQKQLQLSEAKSQNLSADKTKLENEIAELMKSSGNNSERLTYLNDQLREKDRLIDEVKTSLAEAQANAGLLTGEIAQAKESYASDVDRLNKSHDEQIKTLTNQINSLKTEVQRNKDENTRLVQVHRAELETLEQTNHVKITAISTQIDEKVEQFQNLSEDLNTTKTQLQTTTKERDDFKESQSKIQDEVAMLQEKLLKSTTLSETISKDLKTMQTQHKNIIKEHDTLKEKCSNFESEIQSKQNEVREVNLKLEAVVTERSLLTSAQGDTEKKVTEVLEKYDKLNAQHQALLQEKGESVKLCHEKENQVKKVNLEKDVILQEKNTTETKLEELQVQYTALESQITVIKAQLTKKENELTQLRSSATDGVSQISQLQSQLEEIKSERDQFKSKIVVLGEQSALQQQQMKSLNQEKADAENGKIEMSTALSLSQEQIQSLTARLEESERNKAAQSMNASMENDLEATRHVLKLKEDELKKYKQQVLDLKKQIATTGIKQSTNQESQGNADLAVKLVEVEDLLEATQAEKENLDAQVEFLNSVIVDLQRKNEENEQRIELLMSGGSRTNGLLDSPEMDEEPAIPRFNVRLFCDICDVFDEHDTDDCPTQASDPQDDVGSMHHGSRTESRPYCTTCEVFGHWTQDCDDEETF